MSKYNSTRENHLILLMITDDEKWHYLAVKSLSALLKGITSNRKGDFYCLNCLRAYTAKDRLEEHKNVRENHDYCDVEMPEEDNKILKYNQGEKSMKVPLIIYADLERLLEKMSTCLEHCSFDEERNKLSHYRGEDSMKKFCKVLREHVTKIINYEKKEMISLTRDEWEFHNKQKIYYICKKGFNTYDSNKEYHKAKDHCHYTGKYRGAAHNICNL